MENMKNVKIKGEGIHNSFSVCGERVCVAPGSIPPEDCPVQTEPRAESIANMMQEADQVAINAYLKATRIHSFLDCRPNRAEPTCLVNHIAIHRDILCELCRELDVISDIIGC